MTDEAPKHPATRTRCDLRDDRQVWTITLDAPVGNIIDAAMVRELRDIVRDAGREAGLKALLIRAEGPDFSYGASVQEHRADQAAGMLQRFHGLLAEIATTGIPVVAAVRGRCLGGGLELAAFCHRVFAATDARLGQPEIKLGVFAPVASVILAERIGRGRAEELLFTGRSVGAEEALGMGLVDVIADDPEASALAWIDEHLSRLSASSLRLAVQAARQGYMRRFSEEIGDLEKLYLDRLMATADAREGIEAFLDKRGPIWRDA